jgi:hypothetical protein
MAGHSKYAVRLWQEKPALGTNAGICSRLFKAFVAEPIRLTIAALERPNLADPERV